MDVWISIVSNLTFPSNTSTTDSRNENKKMFKVIWSPTHSFMLFTPYIIVLIHAKYNNFLFHLLSFLKKKLKQVRKGGLPYSFSKIGKSALIWRKNVLIVVMKLKFLRVSRQKKKGDFFPVGPFCLVWECLLKCTDSKKTPLP